MNQYPLQGIAQQLQAQGRHGDSVLVHMNPIEAQGLASLSPTGQLTLNPQTGQPEAFLPMLLIPMLASMGGSAAAGAMGGGAIASALAGGLASGVAQGALTGDWEKGLASGMIGAGVGGALGAAGSAAGEAATTAATDAGASLLDAGTQAAVEGAAELSTDAIAQQVASEGASSAIAPLTEEATSALTEEGLASLTATAPPELLANPNAAGAVAEAAGPTTGYGSGFDVSKFSGESFMDALKQPFQEGSGLGGKLMKSQTMLPIAMGAGQLATMEANEDWEKESARLSGNLNDQKMAGYNSLQDAYRFARGMAAGGPVYTESTTYSGGGNSGSYGQYQSIYDRMTKKERKAFDKMSAKYGFSPYMMDYGQDPNRIDPLEIQAGLRGATSVNPNVANPNFRPGFDAEAMYFQDIKNEAGEIDPSMIQAPASNPTMAYGELQRMAQPETDYLQAFTPPPEEKKEKGKTKGKGYAGGGDVTLQTELGPHNIPGGGLAGLPSPYVNPTPESAPPAPPAQPQADNPSPMVAAPEAGGQPSEQDIQMLALALTGEIGDKADMVVERFINEFGVEMFREAREFILKFYGGGDAQTEGMISGMGGGMDDQIPGTIAGQEGVAVSPGEYIVPADVVSGLGDGSSEAGASELDAMMGRVRMARGGTVDQPPPFDATRVLPA